MSKKQGDVDTTGIFRRENTARTGKIEHVVF